MDYILKSLLHANILIHAIFPQFCIPRNDTELGLEAKKFTSSGLLVPDNLVTKVVLAELRSNEDKSWLLDGRSLIFILHTNVSSNHNNFMALFVSSKKFFFSGYPRTVSQAEELDRNYLVDVVLNLDVPFETITERISVSVFLFSGLASCTNLRNHITATVPAISILFFSF